MLLILWPICRAGACWGSKRPAVGSLCLAALVGSADSAPQPLPVSQSAFDFIQTSNSLIFVCRKQPVATYVFHDDQIRRPYFANLHAPGSVQVTRSHPPVASADPTDHDTMHPGLWLAFGDISGHDFWRNKASIEHLRFLQPATLRNGELTFATENRLVTAQGRNLGTQISRICLKEIPAGYFLVWEASFIPQERDFAFGDQEEMGLGVRVATAITEKNGGLITGSTGATTAAGTWGRALDWCDYSGIIGSERVGVTLMPDPRNFRPSWWHNRDYGLMVANPFGRNALKQGEASRVKVEQGETFRLRFGVLLHAEAQDRDLNVAEVYRRFRDGALP